MLSELDGIETRPGVSRPDGANPDSACITLDISCLEQRGAAYVGEAVVAIEFHGEVHRLFTGIIERVEISEGQARMFLVARLMTTPMGATAASYDTSVPGAVLDWFGCCNYCGVH